MGKKELNNKNKKHNAAIQELYIEEKVKNSLNHRLKYWKNQGGSVFTSLNPGNKETLAVYELCYLLDRFPGDFS